MLLVNLVLCLLASPVRLDQQPLWATDCQCLAPLGNYATSSQHAFEAGHFAARSKQVLQISHTYTDDQC
jgi:hypothetical protein